MKLAKWGNSYALRIPKSVVEAMGWTAGIDINLHAHGPRDVSVACKPDRDAFIASLLKYQGRLPADFKFDREEANRRD